MQIKTLALTTAIAMGTVFASAGIAEAHSRYCPRGHYGWHKGWHYGWHKGWHSHGRTYAASYRPRYGMATYAPPAYYGGVGYSTAPGYYGYGGYGYGGGLFGGSGLLGLGVLGIL